MAQSLSMVYIHIIFHVKNTSVRIKEEDLNRVHAYIAGLIKQKNDYSFWVDGVEDHVHVLCSLSRNETIADLVGYLKRESCKGIKRMALYYSHFEWQAGYGVFSVSKSHIGIVKNYLKNQREHHKNVTFHDEYIRFLDLHGITYDESYVLED